MKKVVVYSKPDCVKCRMTKVVLGKSGVAFEEDEVFDANGELSETLLGRWRDAGFEQDELKSAPVVVVMDDAKVVDAWSDFRVDKIKALS